MPAWFETVASEIVYNGWSTVRRDVVRTPQGEDVEREVVLQDDAVAMVPLLDDGTVILLRQYRHPFGTSLLEVPAGKLDVEGEPPAAAARRELTEEIGYETERLELLVTIANSVGWTDERTHIFLATGLRAVPRPDDFVATAEEAAMEVVRLPLQAAVEAVRDGRIPDAKTVVGLLFAAHHQGNAA
ncbi:MAG: NUDIX hydrolase [Actinobacteria bacterium]|nr:NUDIX hydrolase [Actinomycetota bacterium]